MISLIITLIVLGIIFYFISLIPMASPFPEIIKVIAVVLALLIILQFFGIATGIPAINLH